MKLKILEDVVSLNLQQTMSVDVFLEAYQFAVVEIALAGALMDNGVISAG